MDQELDIFNRECEIATYNMRRVCVINQEVQREQVALTQSRLLTVKKCKSFCLLIFVSLSNAL